jgi:hypothetical protein
LAVKEWRCIVICLGIHQVLMIEVLCAPHVRYAVRWQKGDAGMNRWAIGSPVSKRQSYSSCKLPRLPWQTAGMRAEDVIRTGLITWVAHGI